MWADLASEVEDVEVEKQRYRDVRADATESWGEPVLQLQPAASATYELPVDEFGPAAAATDAGHGLVGYTELEGPEGSGLRAVLEYPVKTMNISAEGYPDAAAMGGRGAVWQVDTGPVAVPDLDRRTPGTPQIAAFSLGFIATISTAPHAADFVLEQPTALPPPASATKVLHYSTPYSVPATNRLLAVPR